MAKKPMSDDQKYRPANARGAGPGAEGRAKIKASEKLAGKSKGYDNEGTIYSLRQKGGERLAEDYRRKIGAKASVNSPRYSKGGMVKGKK
jgi:hypothetical protein